MSWVDDEYYPWGVPGSGGCRLGCACAGGLGYCDRDEEPTPCSLNPTVVCHEETCSCDRAGEV